MKTLIALVLTIFITHAPAQALTWMPMGDITPAKVLDFHHVGMFPYEQFELTVEIPCGAHELGKVMSLTADNDLVLGYFYKAPRADEITCMAMPREKTIYFTYPALGNSWNEVIILGEER